MNGCRVGLLGFGTVGSAVARRLTLDPPAAHSPLTLTHIFDRRAALKRTGFVSDQVRLKPDTTGVRLKPDTTNVAWSPIAWSDRIEDVLTSDVDIIVEAIGGTEDALDWTRAALLAGKSVVTCNKQLMAQHGPALSDLAARQGRQLRFEAAVGGAMPIVRAVGDGLAGDRLTCIEAILNGTTNAVLSGMEVPGSTMARALNDARARGYAEADPAADLDGTDARAKLTILCALAFGLRVEPEEIATITAAGLTSGDFEAAARRGETIRQLAHASYDAEASVLTAWVAPSLVRVGSLFGQTRGAQNAAVISGAFAGDVSLTGAGAGGDATAVAVLSDLLAIARDRAAIVPAPKLSRPARVVGYTGNARTAETGLNAEAAKHADQIGLCDLRDLCVDRRPGDLSVDRLEPEVV